MPDSTTPALIKGHRNEHKGRWKAKSSALTGADLHYRESRKDEIKQG